MTELSVHEALFTTRAMRHLRPDPVPREDLEYLIEAATMAPSAGNLQMWAFVVVTDVEHLDEAPAIIVPCLTVPAPDDANTASGLFGSIFPAIQNLLLAARKSISLMTF